VKQSPPYTSAWRQLLSLVLLAVHNPAQTWRLLDLERLKNLYVTLFRQPPTARSGILGFYETLYREQGGPANAEMRSFAATSVPRQLVFPTASDEPQVSIIVPVVNNYDTTLQCLAALLQHTDGVDYELLLADDASDDATRDIQARVQNIRVLRNQENLGFVDNCNQAARQARGQYLVFLNNDTQVQGGWLKALLATLTNEPDVGLVGPQLCYPDGRLQEAGAIVWRDGSGYNYGRGEDPQRPEYRYAKDVDYISGACICIRRALWQAIGGFDTRYRPAYYEDTDLAFAVREQGYRVVYRPRAQVIHIEGISHGRDGAAGIKRFQEINRAKFLSKWRAQLTADQYPDSSHLFRARERSRQRPLMLIIDHHVPFPDRDAGSRSTMQYIRWFIRCGLQVKFIGDNFHRHEPYSTQLEDLGVEVLCGPAYSIGWREWLRRHGGELDYVYLQRPDVAIKYIHEVRRLTRAKRLYFGHDLHWLRLQRQQAVDATADGGAWQRARRREFEVFRASDVIYYPSAVEVEQVKQDFPHKTVRAIPLYVQQTAEPMADQFEQRCGLLFVGGFQHPPNLDAVTWFLKSIQPRLKGAVPGLVLTIVGSNLPAPLRAGGDQGLIVRENLSDPELHEVYAQARLVIAPLRYGAGVKGKIIEALRLQVPVVTTSVGAEGLPDHDRRYLSVADSDAAFAQAVLGLYKNSQAWQAQREQGRLVFNAHFTSAAAARILGQDIRLAEPVLAAAGSNCRTQL